MPAQTPLTTPLARAARPGWDQAWGLLCAMILALGCDDSSHPVAPTSPPTQSAAANAAAAALSFRQVSAGISHTCGVTTDDKAYCWGYNFSGQLGDGTRTQRTVPVAVQGGLRFLRVSAGSSHTCGLATNGRAYCWGFGGLLGDGTTTRRLTPVAVAGTRTFTRLSTGAAHACALTGTHRLFCWGRNTSGEIGDGTTAPRLKPVRAGGTSLSFQGVAAADNYTCAVTTASKAYCWGKNDEGQLGDGTKVGHLNPVAVIGGLSIGRVSANLGHTCALTTAGRAYCWGSNSVGQLGDGSDFRRRLKPVPVRGGLTFEAISTGYGFTCGLTAADAVHCWGSNSDGQLGTGGTASSNTPVAVTGGLDFARMDAGADHACGVTTGDRAYCWGDDFFGNLGDGRSGVGVESRSPVPVKPPA